MLWLVQKLRLLTLSLWDGELLPKTEGNFRAETTKMNAPMSASSGLASGFFFAILERLIDSIGNYWY